MSLPAVVMIGAARLVAPLFNVATPGRLCYQYGMPCGDRGRHAGDGPCGGRRLGRWQPVRPGWLREMFTTKSNPAVARSIIERAGHLPRAIGEKVLLDAVR
jgi:hypothetical protein